MLEKPPVTIIISVTINVSILICIDAKVSWRFTLFRSSV